MTKIDALAITESSVIDALVAHEQDDYRMTIEDMGETGRVVDWLLGLSTGAFLLFANLANADNIGRGLGLMLALDVFILYFSLIYFAFSFKKSVQLVLREARELISLLELARCELKLELATQGSVTPRRPPPADLVAATAHLSEFDRMQEVFGEAYFYSESLNKKMAGHSRAYYRSYSRRYRAENIVRVTFLLLVGCIVSAIIHVRFH